MTGADGVGDVAVAVVEGHDGGAPFGCGDFMVVVQFRLLTSYDSRL